LVLGEQDEGFGDSMKIEHIIWKYPPFEGRCVGLCEIWVDYVCSGLGRRGKNFIGEGTYFEGVFQDTLGNKISSGTNDVFSVELVRVGSFSS
jgi:hypothetical protein